MASDDMPDFSNVKSGRAPPPHAFTSWCLATACQRSPSANTVMPTSGNRFRATATSSRTQPDPSRTETEAAAAVSVVCPTTQQEHNNENALYATGLAMLLALTMSACSKKPAPPPLPHSAVVTVKAVTVGKAIGADKRVTAPASSFAKTDTIYAAVETDGSGTATLKAKWTYHKATRWRWSTKTARRWPPPARRSPSSTSANRTLADWRLPGRGVSERRFGRCAKIRCSVTTMTGRAQNRRVEVAITARQAASL